MLFCLCIQQLVILSKLSPSISFGFFSIRQKFNSDYLNFGVNPPPFWKNFLFFKASLSVSLQKIKTSSVGSSILELRYLTIHKPYQSLVLNSTTLKAVLWSLQCLYVNNTADCQATWPPTGTVQKLVQGFTVHVYLMSLSIHTGHSNTVAREILIFEGAIFSLWNHPFYCSFCRADFKTVFVFKIRPILVVRAKI